MKQWKKKAVAVLGLVMVACSGALGWFLAKAIPVGTGYVAKYLCSSTFVSGRDPDLVFKEDVKPVNPLTKIISFSVDYEKREVLAESLGIFSSKAIFREGCGCTLINGTTAETLRSQTLVNENAPMGGPDRSEQVPWPEGSGHPEDPETLGVDTVLLNRAVEEAFEEQSPDNSKKTRAVLVVYQGKLIAESYASGFHARMPLLGWSMAKSITNALVGILVREGKLDIMAPAPVPEWAGKNDPRKAITLDQLMRMSSGLSFEEVYAPLKDATDMLYGAYDFAAFSASKPIAAAPDSVWNYSSGSANIIAGIVRRAVESDTACYYSYFYDRLFARIGMTSAVIEPDPSGTFVGSSYAFATARDWARFGLLYLQDGVWKNERILPEGWVTYTTTPTAKAPRGEYGALFWLNNGDPQNPEDRRWPDVPRDAFAAKGFQEQKVIIIPSKNLVLVRFGATSDRSAWDTNLFIRSVILSLP